MADYSSTLPPTPAKVYLDSMHRYSYDAQLVVLEARTSGQTFPAGAGPVALAGPRGPEGPIGAQGSTGSPGTIIAVGTVAPSSPAVNAVWVDTT